MGNSAFLMSATVSQERWVEVGTKLFGENREEWVFVCPKCGKEMSVARAKREFPDIWFGKGWSPMDECIGRYVDGFGCDLAAAYGLFRGPLFVIATNNEKRIAMFDFAGRPLTGEGKEQK